MLKDLGNLAEESYKKYTSDFHSADIVLDDEFRDVYEKHISSLGNSISFNLNTTVLTTATALKIYIPNQWFVMAAYFADFINELVCYKNHLENILTQKYSSPEKNSVSKEKNEYIIASKKNFSESQKKDFLRVAETYFKQSNDKNPLESANCIMRFLSDYQWWHGSKTIDRLDFYVSPVLNLLGVVNLTQSYVADIAHSYATTSELISLVPKLKSINSKQSSMSPHFGTKSQERKTGANNYIIYGAPGTGKSHLIEERFGSLDLSRRVVFHPEYTYFDFVGSYKPTPVYKKDSDTFLNSDGTVFSRGEPYISYKFVPGPFIETIVSAWKNPSNMYTLIIEEINRANAPAVFGEAFQLLDRDDSGESEYAVSISEDLMSYFSEINEIGTFVSSGLKIPSNMNIVATMNSADQGVNVLDSAFKRRWNFEYLKIDTKNAIHKNAPIDYCSTVIQWGTFIDAINIKLIKLGIDEDRLIGPYFIKPSEISNNKVVDKLLLYLWDDILRHCREQFFAVDIHTFADLIEKYKYDDVLQINSMISTAVTASEDSVISDNSESLVSESSQ